MNKICWLGSLHYGNYISYEQLFDIYSILESLCFDIHIDASSMYGSGQSLDIIKSLCHSFPSIKVSVKYGLAPRLDANGRWAVDVCSNTDSSLTHTINQYLEYIPIKNLHSFQFHAFSSELLDDWLSQLANYSFFQLFGISNMSLSEANFVRSSAAKYNLNFSFSQIHANIIEQKIISEYLSDDTWSTLICNRSLARGYLSDRFVNESLSSDSRILHSNRVVNSLTSSHKQFLFSLSKIAQGFNISLSQLAYIYLIGFNTTTNVFPIISPKSTKDMLEYVDIYNMPFDKLCSIISGLHDVLAPNEEFLNMYPLYYLEK